MRCLRAATGDHALLAHPVWRGLRSCAHALAAASVLGGAASQAATIVTTRIVPSGEIIEAEDLKTTPTATLGALTNPDEAIGREARRTLYPGAPITPADLQGAAMVRRNEMVRMIFTHRLLNIRTEGRSLDRGAVGDRVRVMNLRSRQTVTGVVVGSGLVEVGE